MSSSSADQQQQSQTSNTDQRVALTDQATYLGLGSQLHYDASQTSFDARDFSSHSADQTQISASDASTRDSNNTTVDSRQFTDQSNSGNTSNSGNSSVDSRSFTDQSNSGNTTIDSRNLSRTDASTNNSGNTAIDSRNLSDNSQQNFNLQATDNSRHDVTDARQFSNVDSRNMADNSQQNFTLTATDNSQRLDPALAQAAYDTVAANSASAANTVEKAFLGANETAQYSIAAQNDLAKAALNTTAQAAAMSISGLNQGNAAGLTIIDKNTARSIDAQAATVEKVLNLTNGILTGAAQDAADNRKFASDLVSSAFTAQTGADGQTAAMLIKYGALAALGIGALVYFNRKAA